MTQLGDEEDFRNIKSRNPYYQITENAYMIFQEKSSANFNSCNCYLIRDEEEITLVDPGCSRESLTNTLKTLKVELHDVKNIVLTHAHSDHYALVNFLKQNSGCEVYVHRLDREFLEDTSKYVDFLFERALLKKQPKFSDLYRILENFVNQRKAGASYQDLGINPIIEMVFNTWDIQTITPDHTFSGNDTLPGNLRAMHLPGHTPGHSGFLSLSHPFVFCGDIDFNIRGPVVSSTNANIHDFKQSIQKLRGIVDSHGITRLFPGHWHPVFSDLESKLDAFGNEFEKKAEQILKILGSKELMTLDEVTQETFKDFINYFQDFINEETKDSLLVGEASELQTNRNYLIELERLKRVSRKLIGNQEYWKLT